MSIELCFNNRDLRIIICINMDRVNYYLYQIGKKKERKKKKGYTFWEKRRRSISTHSEEPTFSEEDNLQTPIFLQRQMIASTNYYTSNPKI